MVYFRCPVCEAVLGYNGWNYCPHCGVKFEDCELAEEHRETMEGLAKK